MGTQVLPASTYNALPEGDGMSPLSDEVLNDLGTILVSHGMQDQLTVALLHRHFELSPGEVMLHEGLRCSPKHGSEQFGLTGNSFFLNDQKFEPFEYDCGKPISMSECFIEEMARYLSGNNLSQTVALSRLVTGQNLLMETIHEDERSHLCHEISSMENPDEATAWHFDVHNGAVRPVVARLCKKEADRGHKRTK